MRPRYKETYLPNGKRFSIKSETPIFNRDSYNSIDGEKTKYVGT